VLLRVSIFAVFVFEEFLSMAVSGVAKGENCVPVSLPFCVRVEEFFENGSIWGCKR
jgi:hypothetical protein